MEIISISLSEKNIQDMGAIKSAWGLSNKSEVVRASLREAIRAIHAEKELTGRMAALLVVQHSHETEKFVSEVKHGFIKLIRSQNHSEINPSQCIDVFMLSGRAEEIKKMKNAFSNNRKVKKISLIDLK